MSTVTVTDRSAPAAALRNLKLSGMLGTLDARLAQAHAGELGHLDFLQVLCQDEISRRETMSLQRRIRRARFETPATLEGFDFNASPKLPAAQIRDLAALRWLAGGESVILYGPVVIHGTPTRSHQCLRRSMWSRSAIVAAVLSTGFQRREGTRGDGLLPGGAACGWGSHVDGGRWVVCDGRAG